MENHSVFRSIHAETVYQWIPISFFITNQYLYHLLLSRMMKNIFFISCLLSAIYSQAANFAADSARLPGVLLLHGTPVIFRLQNHKTR